MNLVAVGVGAALGAWLRWGLGLLLNTAGTRLPYGTLAANLLGGYLAGLAFAFFLDMPGLSPAWRLLAITGFLGGLTTFSTFSIEAMLFLQRAEYGMALAHMGLHLFGSLALCIAGYASYRLLFAAA